MRHGRQGGDNAMEKVDAKDVEAGRKAKEEMEKGGDELWRPRMTKTLKKHSIPIYSPPICCWPISVSFPGPFFPLRSPSTSPSLPFPPCPIPFALNADVSFPLY